MISDLDETIKASPVTMEEVDESDSEIELTKAPEALEECFPKSFFSSVVVNTISFFESNDDETNKEQCAPLERDDKVLTVLEKALPAHRGW